MNYLNNKGSSLYFAVAIIAIVLGVALGTSSILISQIGMIREMSNSVLAVYAADAGMENILYRIRAEGIYPANIAKSNVQLSNNSEYEINPENIYVSGEKECEAANFCIKTIGEHKGVQRAMEVEF